MLLTNMNIKKRKPKGFKLFDNQKYLCCINVLGKPYHIILDGNLTNEDGLCFQQDGIIYLRSNLSDKEHLSTLFHELGHALAYRSGWSQAINSSLEEVIVESFAQMFIDVFGVYFLDDSTKASP